MDGISLNPEFLRALILKLRSVMAQEEEVTPDPGSNATDDERWATLQDSPNNLTRDEIVAQVEDLEPDQQHEIIALMWIGRGDMAPEEWEDALAQAAERASDGTTSAYLLSHPQAADFIDEGVNLLFDGSDFMETGEY